MPALEPARPRRGSGDLCEPDPERAGGQRALGGGEPVLSGVWDDAARQGAGQCARRRAKEI